MPSRTVNRSEMEPYRQTPDEVLNAFDTSARSGLRREQAQERLKRYGKNELATEASVPAWRKFLAQFTDVLVILLLVAALISAGLWLYERESALPYEAIAIFAIVLLNALMGYVQQARAEQAVAALRQMSAAHANVIRDGARQSIPASELVPGDLILVEEGDTVPADARLIQSTALQTAEAALTGESLPVSKDTAATRQRGGLGDRHNMIFSGTAATYGRGRAVVTATGMQTEMGRIAGMLKEAPDETTPLQKELDRVGKLLGIIVVVIAIVMIATIILVEDVRGFSAIFDVLILGVALAVAAVPEGLPAVVTAVLSLGVQRMAKRNAIVRHLAAVETLGSANIIASDKTGTLTKNEMTVRVVVTASGRVTLTGTGYAPEGEVRRDGGETIEGALRFELHACAYRRRPRQQRRAAGARRALDGAGRPDRRRADRRRAQGRAGGRSARRPLRPHRGSALLLRAQADEHDSQRRREAGASARPHQRRAGRPAGALLAGAGRREQARPLTRGAPRGDSDEQRRARRRSAAHARRRLPLAAEGCIRARDVR